MEKAYRIWRAFQDKFLARAAAFLLLGCTLIALLEVFRRYIFGVSWEWQQDAVTFFILAGVFLYFGISQRRDTHLNVVLFTQLLEQVGPRAFFVAEIVKIAALCITFVFLIATVWWGIPEVHDSITYEVRTESLAFVLWPFLASLLVGFAFMAVSVFFQIYREIMRLRGKTVLYEEPEEEVLPH